MNSGWRRGEGYTEELALVPTVRITGGQNRVRNHPPPPPRGSDRWYRVLVAALAVVAGLVVVGSAALVVRSREGGVSRERVERWEDRLDALDQTAVALFDAEVAGAEKQALEFRLEHLQRSLCSDLGAHLGEVPGHLRTAYQQVCEGG